MQKRRKEHRTGGKKNEVGQWQSCGFDFGNLWMRGVFLDNLSQLTRKIRKFFRFRVRTKRVKNKKYSYSKNLISGNRVLPSEKNREQLFFWSLNAEKSDRN